MLTKFQSLSMSTRVCLVAATIATVGLTLGLTLDANAHIPQPWNRVSSVMGWAYFCCWGLCFYPQVIVNYQRKSVDGQSLDYIMLNMLGFVCYAVFNCAFFYSESVQQQYMRLNHGNRNAVEPNDVVFALHAVLLICVNIAQCIYYPRGSQRVGTATIVSTSAIVLAVALFGLAVVANGNDETSIFNLLNLLYLLSYIKLMSTLVKCLPQIYLNYSRKSTVGWTIWGVLLDIPGGVLSIGQQVLDAGATNDWAVITGGPVKFSLAFVSIMVDIEFVLQHFVWYKADSQIHDTNENKPLLPINAPTHTATVVNSNRH